MAGYDEVVKYGLLGDADFSPGWRRTQKICSWRNRNARMRSRCAAAHRRASVARDEREKPASGRYSTSAHTFGHALEAGCGYSRADCMERRLRSASSWLDFSVKQRPCASQEAAQRVRAHLRRSAAHPCKRSARWGTGCGLAYETDCSDKKVRPEHSPYSVRDIGRG